MYNYDVHHLQSQRILKKLQAIMDRHDSLDNIERQIDIMINAI